MEPTDQAQGPQPFGRYTLQRKLALGGMAEIFLARQEGPAGFSRNLVIKRILPHYADDGSFVEMFLDEAKLAAKLSHPNIVPIFEFGEVKGAYFIAMEFIRGPDLKQLLFASQKVEGEGIPFGIQAKIISGCAEALNYAHNLCEDDGTPLNIVHRDVSPSNIIVSYDGIPKLLDFGIAKAASKSHKTQTGILKGKIPYMPPEQLMGRPVDGRVDVYALGVVLFELATRKLPFVGDSDFHLMKLICDSPTPKPSQISDAIPAELERIICRAIEKDPEARYPSARELATDLERFILIEGQPVTTFDIGEYLKKLELGFGQPLGFSSAPRSNPSLARRTPSGMQPLKAPGPVAADIPDQDVPDTSPIDGDGGATQVVDSPFEPEAQEQPAFDSDHSSWSGERTTLDVHREAPLEEFPKPTTEELGPDELEVVFDDEEEVAPDKPIEVPTAIVPGRPQQEAELPPVAGKKLPKAWMLGVGALTVAMLFAAVVVVVVRNRAKTSTVTPLGVVANSTTEAPAPVEVPSEPVEEPTAAPSETPTEEPTEPTEEPTEPTEEPAVPEPSEEPAAEPDPPANDHKAVKARKGMVVLETDPWTEVYQGGKKLGVTPLTVTLNAGKYRLILKNPGQGIEMPLLVKVKGGVTVTKRIKIKPGTLAVLVTPWGEVWVDGRKKGVTPITPLKLTPGKHTIEAVNPKTGKKSKKTVTVVSGRTKSIKFDLN